MKRVIYDVLLLIFIYLLPWWVTLVWAFVGLFIFVNYYEYIISLTMVFLMSFIPEKKFFGNGTLVYSLIILSYFVLAYFKSKIIIYSNKNNKL